MTAETPTDWTKLVGELERLLKLLPQLKTMRYVLALSERLKVDEDAMELDALPDSILRFKEIPNANEFRLRLEQQLNR